MSYSASLDEIAPEYLRDQRFTVRIDGDDTPAANRAVLLVCGYAGAAPQGASPPLIFEAKGPSRLGYRKSVFYRAPATIVWVPREGGLHLITIRELAHNRWFGSLRVQVEGDPLESE